MRVICMYCSLEWDKPVPNVAKDRMLVTHGICDFCVPLADAHIDGYLKNYPVEAVKALALKLRKERTLKHGTDARFR